jgi:flagellar motor switch protein FliN/FliY
VSADPNPSAPDPTTQETAGEPVALSEVPASGDGFSIDALMDVSMPVIIEIGRAMMPLSEVVDLKPGAVIQLDRLVGDAVDVYVGDRKLAEGEVVVLEDRFGVRLTRILAKPEGERG